MRERQFIRINLAFERPAEGFSHSQGHKPTFAERLDAARAAAPFYAPKFASIEQNVTGEMVQRIIFAEPLSDEEWERRYGHGNGATNWSGHR